MPITVIVYRAFLAFILMEGGLWVQVIVLFHEHTSIKKEKAGVAPTFDLGDFTQSGIPFPRIPRAHPGARVGVHVRPVVSGDFVDGLLVPFFLLNEINSSICGCFHLGFFAASPGCLFASARARLSWVRRYFTGTQLFDHPVFPFI